MADRLSALPTFWYQVQVLILLIIYDNCLQSIQLTDLQVAKLIETGQSHKF